MDPVEITLYGLLAIVALQFARECRVLARKERHALLRAREPVQRAPMSERRGADGQLTGVQS